MPKNKFHSVVLDKIESYRPQGGLDQTSRFFIHMVSVRHGEVRDHCERVALLSEAVALHKDIRKDPKSAFFGGLFHDVGKVILPWQLFDGRNISSDEYALVKEHAYDGFNILRDMHLFTALCSGSHHAMRKPGYGATMEDLPKEWGLDTIKKVLEISAIIAICDFIDAFTHRKTEIKDGSDAAGPDLKTMLEHTYPNDAAIIKAALALNARMKLLTFLAFIANS